MKTIPQVRKELLEIANTTRSPQLSRKLKLLVNNMYRRPAVRRAAKEHAEYTPELGRRIKLYALGHPTASYTVIAAHFDVSIGRVSEAIAGKRAA